VTLIDAYARLHTDRRLVLAGARGWLYDEVFARVAALGLDGDVVFPGYVPAAELALWYNAAEVFAYPSAYEGFMPVARRPGTPMSTGISALPERPGRSAAGAGRRRGVASALAALLDSPEARASDGCMSRPGPRASAGKHRARDSRHLSPRRDRGG
jgi:glycosyltransferase involved in cell wall biosynthesis